MKIKIEAQEIVDELRTISTTLNAKPVQNDAIFSEIVKRLANVEARIQTLESLLVTKTVAGKPKLTDEGQRVGKQWYQK